MELDAPTLADVTGFERRHEILGELGSGSLRVRSRIPCRPVYLPLAAICGLHGN